MCIAFKFYKHINNNLDYSKTSLWFTCIHEKKNENWYPINSNESTVYVIEFWKSNNDGQNYIFNTDLKLR